MALLNSKTIEGHRTQKKVISALMYRELKTRVSQVQFGVLGVFIEPIGVMTIFLSLYGITRGFRGASLTNFLDYAMFLLPAIVTFSLFNEIAIRSLNAMLANEALFFYKPVKPIDTVIARTLVETGLYSVMYIALIFIISLLREKFYLLDFPFLLLNFLLAAVISFGVGLILMVAGHRYVILYQIIPLFMRPLWLISGIFYGVSQLPPEIQPFVSWWPVFQSIEISRYILVEDYIIDFNIISIWYLIFCAVLLLFLGLFIYKNNERILLRR